MNVKSPSRRTLLIAAVCLALVAHLTLRYLNTPVKSSEPPPGSAEAVSLASREIAPSISTLARMGYEWKQHIAALPPEQRAASQARLDEEKAFFLRAAQLAPGERDRVVKQHLEELMNDPELQTLMAEDRFKKLAKLSPETRRELLKSYVNYKSQVTGR